MIKFVSRWARNIKSSKTATRTLRASVAVLALVAVTLVVPKSSAAPAGLVASYNFNAGTGTSLADISGTGNNGTVSGATWNAAGKTGSALSFDGVNDYVNVPDSSSLDLTNGVTLEAWVRPTALGTGGSGWRTVIFKRQPTHMVYALYANQHQGRPTAQVNIGGEKNAIGTSQIPLNSWTHLASTYDGSALKLYVNGVQVSSTPLSGNIPVTTGELRFGGNAVWGEWFRGLIDDIRIYNRALSVSEIQSDMNTPVTPPVADTTPPTTPANLLKTGQTENSISVSWSPSTDNVAVSDYGLYKNFVSSGSSAINSATFTGLNCGTSYSLGVDAVDGAGNRSAQTTISASTDDCDTTAPSVQITTPAGGTTISGAVNVAATATDNKTVSGVQFKLDGNNLSAEDTTAPYSVNWDTTAGINGNHTLTAVARDGSGNQTTSLAVTVNVSNQTPNFVNDNLIIGLDEPTQAVFTPDGRMFIIERGGRVWVAQPGALSVEPTPLLDLPSVATADERGLLGITIDPNFSTNGYFYVFYTNSTSQMNRVSRFTAVGNSASLSSETLIWQNDVVAPIWHQGGDLTFGPDGYLYISVGDHLDGASAQSLGSYNGKILRVNSTGTAPTDNPFYDGAGPNKDAIWIRGLRNPFRFSIDNLTGRMFIGDVGQGTWEEVNVGVRGANYGWPTCEGVCSVTGMTNPIYTYNHNNRDASVTGGFVYRGNQFPVDYQGNYFFGDYSQNWIKRIILDGNGNFSSIQNFVPANGAVDGPHGDIVALTMGPDGSLYYVDNGPFAANNAGSIRRVKNINANQPPTSQISADTTSGPAPLAVNFSSGSSADPEGQPITYSWDFGDGTGSVDANPTHTYSDNGRYTVRLTTSDGTNSTPSNTLTVTTGSPPQATITAPVEGLKFRAGDTISFNGEASDPDDGVLPSQNLSWKVVFHHETHIHPFIDSITGSSGSFQIPSSGHSYSGNTWYEIVLTATDSDGIQSQKSVNVYPDKVNLDFSSQPPGLTITIDGIPQTTPFVQDTLIGYSHTISVASPQFIGGSRYDFTSWSDLGAQSHDIVATATPQSYTANFTLVNTAPQGLVAAYSFDEGNGSTLYDVSGNNNNGTLLGPIWSGTGRNSGSLQFDGTNDSVSVEDSSSLDLTSGMTLEAWVHPTSPSTGWRTAVLKEQPGQLVYGLYSNTDTSRPSGHVFIGGDRDTRGTAAVALNTWTHLATTYDGTALRFFVNGVQVSSLNMTGNITTSNGLLRIGGNSVWGEWFKGFIDEVRIYNRALTATELQNDMNTPINFSF